MSAVIERPGWWTDQATRHARAVAAGLELFDGYLRRTQWDEKSLHSLVEQRRSALARRAGAASSAALAARQVLTKATLRERPESLLSGEVAATDMLTVRTSGTTGIPTVVHHSDDYLVERFAQRMRMFEAYEIPWHPRTLIVSAKPGHPLVSFGTRAGGSSGTVVVVNASAVDATNRGYVDAVLGDFAPHVMAGQSMELLALAELVDEGTLRPPTARTAICQGDVLTAQVRATIERACAVRVRDTYGLQEVGQVAFECPDAGGRYHVNAEAVDLDVDSAGGLLVTSLVNRAMSIIRYETGDRVCVSGERCPCGRTLPVISEIEGRARPLIRGADGRRTQATALQTLVSRAYGEFWQIRHDAPGKVTVHVASPTAPEPHDALVREGRALYDVSIEVAQVDRSDLVTTSGKLDRYGASSPSEVV